MFLWGVVRKVEYRGEVIIPGFKQTGAFMNKGVCLSGNVRLVRSGGRLRDVPIRFMVAQVIFCSSNIYMHIYNYK